MMFGYALGSAALLVIVWLFGGVRRIGAISQGAPTTHAEERMISRGVVLC